MSETRPKGRTPPPGLLDGLSQKLEELDTAVARKAERFQAVMEIGTTLASTQDVDSLLGPVIDRLAALLDAPAATLFMLDDERGELTGRVVRGNALRELRVPVGEGLAGHVARTGRPVRIDDAYDDPRFNREVDRRSGFRTRSMIVAPLRHVSGRILGVVQVLHRRVGAFGEEELALVEAIATQIAGVLDSVRLMETLRSQNDALRRTTEELSVAVRDLDLLYELEQAVHSSEAEEELLERVLSMAMGVLGASGGSILLTDGEGRRRYVLGDLTPDSAGRGSGAKGVTEEGILRVPIKGDDQLLGVFELHGKPAGFDGADERLATLVAGLAGRAVMLRRLRVEGERKARLEAIGRVMSGVMHDLKTPMTIIGGYAQLMAMEDSAEERARIAATIERQVEQIASMTGETLAYARGEKELLRRRVYLEPFFEQVRTQLEPELARVGGVLELVLEDRGSARFDETKLLRAISNVARNAIEAMARGGTLRVLVAGDARTLHLTVSDDGPGVPATVMPRAFDAFVTEGKPGGSGLGLAIVKQLVEAHGGQVSLQSEPGQGATVCISLPR